LDLNKIQQLGSVQQKSKQRDWV